MRPCLHGNMSDEAPLNFGAGSGGYLGCKNFILVTSEIAQLDSFTIKGDFKRVGMLQSADLLDRVGPQLRSDLVFGVNREVVLESTCLPVFPEADPRYGLAGSDPFAQEMSPL